jgi:hypothetical protein
MIRKLQSGECGSIPARRIRKPASAAISAFKSRAAAEKHERAVQYFKRH